MTSINAIVNIALTIEGTAVTQAAFNQPLIVGTNAPRTVTAYASAAAMLVDGFVTANPEYIYAQKSFSQELAPPLVYVGKRTSAVAQVDTFSVGTLGTTGAVFSFTLNGTTISYTEQMSDTQALVLNGLLTAIGTAFPTNAPVTGAVSGSGGSATLTLTSATAGAGITYGTITSNLTHTAVTPNHGIVDDLTTIRNTTNGDLWYGLCLCSNSDADILQTAAYIESTGSKIFAAASADGAIETSSTTDLASQLKALGYTRTLLIFSPNNYNLGIDAGLLGGQLPQAPGSSTWKFKTVVGCTPDNFTASQRQFLIGTQGVSTGKNVNIYETIGGVNIIEEGMMVGGQFIDVTVFLDWLTATMQSNVYAGLVSVPKVPYTDKGITSIANLVRQTLKQGSDDGGNGGISAASIVVTQTPLADIPSQSQIGRILPAGALTFSCQLTGALHFVNITGTIVL